MTEAIPSSITGKGAAAPGGSVLDHRFGASAAYTLGVEEEYMLLDPETFDLVQHVDTVLAAVAGGELAARINPELMQSTVEITTPVCRTAGEVERELRAAYFQSLIGRRLTVLVEGPSEQTPGCWVGTSCRYAPVETSGAASEPGEIVDVRAERLADWGGIVAA